jgi:hypothetical protein
MMAMNLFQGNSDKEIKMVGMTLIHSYQLKRNNIVDSICIARFVYQGFIDLENAYLISS